jgi:hypothetical protein
MAVCPINPFQSDAEHRTQKSPEIAPPWSAPLRGALGWSEATAMVVADGCSFV